MARMNFSRRPRAGIHHILSIGLNSALKTSQKGLREAKKPSVELIV